jgi:diguanylate cyclase (GGDEF)-like protein
VRGEATPQTQEDGGILWNGVLTDITGRKKMEEDVRQMAFYDSLTGLPNRRLLNDRLVRTQQWSKRNACYGALMFVDLDRFKPVNDAYGHEVGDLLLIEAAARLQRCVRETDTVARFGGDEFVVIVSELNKDKGRSMAQAELLAEKIRNSMSQPYLLTAAKDAPQRSVAIEQCTASIGVVLFFDNEAGKDDLLQWADAAMYQAKQSGRNAIRFYTRD